MIPVVRHGGEEARAFIEKFRARSEEKNQSVDEAVREILENVRTRGDEAVSAYTQKFDGVCPEKTEISRAEMETLSKTCDPAFLAALKEAAGNIRDFHARQKQQSWCEMRPDGVCMGQRVRGLKRVGIYVPGGTAAYPSSVLMNAIPAKIAGVGRSSWSPRPGRPAGRTRTSSRRLWKPASTACF